MRVFEVLPDGFFSVLTGKNREVYVDLLLVIREEYKRTMHLDRSSIISLIANRLSDLAYLPDLSEDAAAEDENTRDRNLQAFNTDISHDAAYPLEVLENVGTGDSENSGKLTLSGMAHMILRRLLSTGWIEQEQKQGSFEFLITVPEYSIGMMDFLFQITQEDTRAYKNYAFAAYTSLRSLYDDTSKEYWFTALINARESSRQLMDALKMLLNNIRRYHRKLSDYGTANTILKGHFDEYQQLVNERIFHPLVTRDAVQRFRQPVFQMIAEIHADEAKMVILREQGIREAHFAAEEEAAENIRSILFEIYDIFDSVGSLMNDIQNKNNAYTKASVDKLIYLLYQDRTRKEQIAHILMKFGNLTKIQKEELAGGSLLTNIKYFDEQSLYTKGKQKIRSPEAPIRLESAAKSDSDLKQFLTEYQSRYTYTKTMDFVRRIFGDGNVVYSTDFPVHTKEDFIFLLMSVIYGSENRSFYRIEFLSESQQHGAYQYPKIRYSRKKEIK